MIHENIELTGSFTVSGSFVLPNHSTTASLVEETGSMYHDSVDGVLKVYTGTQWVTVGEQALPVANTDIEYLLAAGGGGGGNNDGGGGGAGGLLSSSLASVNSGSSFTVTIGSGGAGAVPGVYRAYPGDDSTIAGDTISTITAVGGGAGDSENTVAGDIDGGSGGGGKYNSSGGSGTVGQGNDGGTGNPGPLYAGAGGGGAGQVGGNASSTKAGNGGSGSLSNITGTPTYYAGGGGAGEENISGNEYGTGGPGGGGNGNSEGNADNGTANTGGGGGGAGYTGAHYYGGSGGSGVAIFAYNSGSFNGAGGIVGDAGNGRKYNQFNESGTFKVGNTTTDFQIVTDSLQFNLDAGNFASRGTSTWTDLSGNGNNATVVNAVLDKSHYYTLDGTSDYFSVPFNSNFNSSNFTTETWVRFDNFSNYQHLMCYFVESSGQRVFFMRTYGANSRLEFGTYNSSDSNQNLQSATTNLSTSTWYHIVGTADGTNLKIYINGTLDISTAQTLSINTGASNRPIRIGNIEGYEGTYDVYGDIAQSRYYSKALSAAEVLQNYNATKTNFV